MCTFFACDQYWACVGDSIIDQRIVCCSGEADNELPPQHSSTRDFSEQQPVDHQSPPSHHLQSTDFEQPGTSNEQPPTSRGVTQQPPYTEEEARYQAGGVSYNRPQSDGPQPQEGSYRPYSNHAAHDEPSIGHADFDYTPATDAVQPQLQARGPSFAQPSTGEASRAGAHEGEARQEQPHNMEGSYTRPYAGRPSQGEADQVVAPHQPQVAPWLSPDGAYAREASQQQPSGYEFHQHTGVLGYHQQLNPGATAHDQVYTGGANRDHTDPSDWTGSIPVVRWQQAAPGQEAAEQLEPVTHPMLGGSFTGSYSVRRRTEHTSDSGTWFQPWQPQHQDQQTEPLYSHYGHPQRDQFEHAPAQYQYQQPEPSYDEYQQGVSQHGQFEHAPAQRQQPQPSYGEYQQGVSQHGQFDHAPAQHQQMEPSYDEYQHHPQLQAEQAEYSQHQHAPPQQQPSYDDYQHAQWQGQPASHQYHQDQQQAYSPGQQEATLQHDQYEYELPQRQQSLRQEDRYDQDRLSSHQAQPLREYDVAVQSQREVFPQYGQHEQGPFQEQQMPPQNRQCEHAPSEYHQAQLQSGHYDEAVPQHELDMPSHPDQHEPLSQQQRGPSQQEGFEWYERAMPQSQQAAPMLTQDGTRHQADIRPDSGQYEQPFQHEHDAPYEAPQSQAQQMYEQSAPEHTVTVPSYERTEAALPWQSDQYEHFQAGASQEQESEAHHDQCEKLPLQYQQAGPQYEQQDSPAAPPSQQRELPFGSSAPSFQRPQAESELSQPQPVPLQPAGTVHEDATSQWNECELAASQLEPDIPAATQPDQFEAEETQHEHAEHENLNNNQPQAASQTQEQQALLPHHEGELQRPEQQALLYHGQGISAEGPARSSSGGLTVLSPVCISHLLCVPVA